MCMHACVFTCVCMHAHMYVWGTSYVLCVTYMLESPHIHTSAHHAKPIICVYTHACSLLSLSLKSQHTLQVKILRDPTRQSSSGVGRSRGHGFVEFTTHDSALTALRAVNNNPDLFGPQKVHAVCTYVGNLCGASVKDVIHDNYLCTLERMS